MTSALNRFAFGDDFAGIIDMLIAELRDVNQSSYTRLQLDETPNSVILMTFTSRMRPTE